MSEKDIGTAIVSPYSCSFSYTYTIRVFRERRLTTRAFEPLSFRSRHSLTRHRVAIRQGFSPSCSGW
jgi:hypothetical protein